MNRLLLSAVLLAIGLLSQAHADRPNVVVIMVDDMGYSDLGCYGSEIDTPRIDELATSGVRFSQFYNTAKCHSSRVSLLTGQYCIAAGDTSLSHAVTSAEVLRDGGYFTAMTGKWHLKQQPTDFGFDRYFGHLSGACNFFKGDNSFRLNGEPWQVPKSDFYTTVADVDFAIEFLDEARATEKPWYLYIAFNAPHAPLHALPEDYEKYKGKYAEGWDRIREARFNRQKDLGIFGENLKASPRPEHIPAWKDMPTWRQDYEANRMTTLAAMIDRVDQEVGRLIDNLKTHNEFENTLILFVSDNGACPYDRKKPILDAVPTNGDVAFGDSTGWAWARNTPFRYYKQNQFEGGISTPGIVHWPAGLKAEQGSIIHTPAHLIDVLPTLAELSECPIPSSYEGRSLRPVSGVSLAPLLEGKKLEKRPPIHLQFASDRGLRDGDWKAVSFRKEPWELFKVSEDRTELNDLASQHPARLRQMVETWEAMCKEVLHAQPSVYSPPTDAKPTHLHPEWTNFEAGPTDPPNHRSKNTSNSRTKNPIKPPKHIRARKNTKLEIDGSILKLRFTGNDPGIAIDLRRKQLPAGPYLLKFRLKGGSRGGGMAYLTTDNRTTLPNGTKIPFEVSAKDDWQETTISLSTKKTIKQLRIDVSDGIGQAQIDQLRLESTDEKTLLSWP